MKQELNELKTTMGLHEVELYNSGTVYLQGNVQASCATFC